MRKLFFNRLFRNWFSNIPIVINGTTEPSNDPLQLTPHKPFRIGRIVILLFIISSLSAQMMEYNHPELEWKSFETDNFVVHFHQGTKRTALLVGKIAEEIHPYVTRVYNFYPEDKTHFVIRDMDDYSNGGAFFFDNKVEIWASNLDYIMRGTKNWLRDVVTHEYVHMISIQNMIKSNTTFPYGFLQFFGYEKEKRKDVVRGFPNVLVSYPISSINLPVWFAEGVAQHQVDTARYDYRDPHREMIIRDRILNSKLLTYNEMGVFGKCSHGNESSYNLGFAFIDYLTDRFGEEILEEITAKSSEWTAYTFDGVMDDVLDMPVDTVYNQWTRHLKEKYFGQTSQIRKNLHKGEAIETDGTANLYPVFSPDGRYIAYTSNAGEDYFGVNQLVVYDVESATKKKFGRGIASSLSWSADGRYLVYARQKKNSHGSSYRDLFLFDIKNEEEIRLTFNLRGSNPAFSRDGKKIAFVGETNGLHQLNLLYLPQDLKENLDISYSFDIESGALINQIRVDATKYRQVRIIGGKLEQLLTFGDGRQIYHPRWNGDDSKIVFGTAIEYGRNIGQFDLETSQFSFILKAREELRYPVYHPHEPWVYYSASTTGITNLYRMHLETGHKELLSNVTGGAFMPAVNAQGEIVYAAYDSLGYHIYKINKPAVINAHLANYEKNYINSIPAKNFDNTLDEEPQIKDYKQQFTDVHILPRLLIDYKTVKPGVYVVSNDVLDKYSLIGGVAVNSNFDYDLYGNFEIRDFKPTFFVEAFNMNANIEDTLHDVRGTDYTLVYDRDINFNLTEVRVGGKGKMLFSPIDFLKKVDFELSAIWRKYSAKLQQKPLYDPIHEKWDPGFTFRYDYLKGWALQSKFIYDYIGRNKDSDINPNSGGYFFLKYAYEHNDFLTGFATSTTQIDEIYTTYAYNTLIYDWEHYFQNPLIDEHTFSIRLRGGLIDRPVDSYFNLYAGGFIGMKGYSYFSIGGRESMVGSVAYRFPLVKHFDSNLGHIYFDKLYFGLFYDYGNAWDGAIDFKDFKQDIGLQLRLSTFSYSLFPTKFFLEAAYPLNVIHHDDVKYQQDWRFYFGALFEFDLRERMGQFLHRLSYKKILY